MRIRLPAGFDSLTLLLLTAGAALVAASLIVAWILFAPPGTPEATALATPRLPADRAAAALPADQVATVLYVDAATGAGAAARSGDRVDVLGYFARQVTGTEGETRVLLQDVPVLNTSRTGNTVALTLAVGQDRALLLHEAQALGARAFVTLRSDRAGGSAPGMPASFSDADLAERLAGPRQGAVPTR
jgi:hypothetical protein